MTKIKAVIFDMDGVLIDARDWHYEALNKALNIFGMEISRYDHLVTYDGLPTMKKLEMLSLERGLPKDLHQFINDLKQQYTSEIIFAKCRPTFAHQYALSKLKAEGYQLAVCSNSVKNTVETMLGRADLLRFIEFYLSNQDVKKSKPDPEIYTQAIQRLGVSPAECLVVEDNLNGIKAAKAAGAHVLEIGDISEVNYANIAAMINTVEGYHA
jgi:HAD superfamily hydrolase (TIGR01509 family)